MRRDLSLLAVLCVSGLAHAADPEPPHVAAARKRQEAVKSLVVTFERTETVTPSAYSYRNYPHKPPTVKFPKEKLVLTSVNRLVIDGNHARYENRHPTKTTPTVVPQETLSIVQGTRLLRYYPLGMTGEGGACLTIHESQKFEPLFGWTFWLPVTNTFRGVDPTWNWNTVTRLNENATLEHHEPDKPFTLLKKTDGDSQYWVRFDHGQDYVMTRFESESKDGIQVDMRVTYSKHDVCGWVPSSWVFSDYYKDGSPLTTTQIKVLDLKVNEPVEPEEFQLTVLPGTRVYDSTKEPHREYVIQEDGSELDVTPTPPPPNPEGPSLSFWPYLAGGLLIGCGGLAVVLLMKRPRRRAHNGTSLGHDFPS